MFEVVFKINNFCTYSTNDCIHGFSISAGLCRIEWETAAPVAGNLKLWPRPPIAYLTMYLFTAKHLQLQLIHNLTAMLNRENLCRSAVPLLKKYLV